MSAVEKGEQRKEREFVGRYTACERSRCHFMRFSEIKELFNHDVSSEIGYRMASKQFTSSLWAERERDVLHSITSIHFF